VQALRCDRDLVDNAAEAMVAVIDRAIDELLAATLAPIRLCAPRDASPPVGADRSTDVAGGNARRAGPDRRERRTLPFGSGLRPCPGASMRWPSQRRARSLR